MNKNYTTHIDFTSFVKNNLKELSILKNNLDKAKDSSLDNFEKQFIYKQIVLHCFILIESSFRHAFIEAVINNIPFLKEECRILINNAIDKDALIGKVIGQFGSMDTLKEIFTEKVNNNPFYEIKFIKDKFEKYGISFRFDDDYIKEFTSLKSIRNLIVHSNTVNISSDVLNPLDETDVQKYLNIVEETLHGLNLAK